MRQGDGFISSDQMSLKKTEEYTLPRSRMYGVAIFVGVLAGIANSFLAVDFSPRPALAVWILLSILVVVCLHEAVHGAAALLLGHRPVFGLKPPLVYITFAKLIPKNHFIFVALAPLVILDIFFGCLYTIERLRLFANLSFTVNTIGAVGDVWIVLRLLNAPKGAMIQDTKTGIEVWVAEKE